MSNMLATPSVILSLAILPLIVFAFIAILNILTFPRLASTGEPGDGSSPSSVSILIPMRNEARVIAETVKSLVGQSYAALEIILLDDNSTDGSAEIASIAARGDPRLRIITGEKLPTGWLGKNWACHQLSEHSHGDLLIFSDADVRWEPGAVSALVTHMAASGADVLTAWPTQRTITWGERLVVPLMGFSIMAYLPILAVHFIPWPVFAAAIGQCLVFRKNAYQRIGGHQAIRADIADDMALAYATKREHLRLRMVDASNLLSCRMYENWPGVRDGYAKNILAGHANNLVFLIFSTIFHWWVFVMPWLWLIYEIRAWPGNPLIAFLLCLAGVLVRALTAHATRQRMRDAVLMPVSVILMTIIAAQAIHWRFFGGMRWKDRALSS